MCARTTRGMETRDFRRICGQGEYALLQTPLAGCRFLLSIEREKEGGREGDDGAIYSALISKGREKCSVEKSGSGSCGGLCAIRVLLEDNAFNPPSIIQSDRGSAFEEEVALLVLAGLFVDVHVCARTHMRDCVCVYCSR